MSLADEYRRQRAWRDWPAVLDALPPLRGRTVLDLGCALGDQAAELAARGARVVGVDSNEELLSVARSRGLVGAQFVRADLRDPLALGEPADGLWCSFAAAYFPDLSTALGRWRRALRPGGWVALVEVDDLFGHEPLEARTRSLLESNAREALAAGFYDFHMGGKLGAHLARAASCAPTAGANSNGSATTSSAAWRGPTTARRRA